MKQNALSALQQALQAFMARMQPQATPTPAPHMTMDQAVKQMQANGWRVSNPSPSTAPVTPQTTAQPQSQGGLTLRAYNGRPEINIEDLKANIAKTYPNAPILGYLDKLVQAGNMMPEHIDPMLPIVMSLRETQGGADNVNPAKNANMGQNNIFNIRDGSGSFVNYPDVKTAILGGYNPQYNHQSAGFVGAINHSVPDQSDYYAKFRQTGDMADLFNHYSPPGDSNGPIPEQVKNYNWIRGQIAPDASTPTWGGAKNAQAGGSSGVALANFNQ